MSTTAGKTFGWVVLAAGAIWLGMGLWGIFMSGSDGFFIKIVVPIFGMATAMLFIRQKI